MSTLHTQLTKRTPLLCATMNSHNDCVSYLLGKGADVNEKDKVIVQFNHLNEIECACQFNVPMQYSINYKVSKKVIHSHECPC